MQLAYLLTAGRAIQDSNTGKFSYIDVFETILIPKDSPSTYQTFIVAGKILGVSTGSFQADIRIVGPEGSVIDISPLIGDVQAGDLEIAAQFNLTKIESLGKYLLKVSVGGVDLQDNDRFFFQVIKQG